MALELTTDKGSEEIIGVRIDGEFYAYVNPLNWSLSERAEFRKKWKRLESLESMDTVTPKQEEDYVRYTEQMVAFLVPDLTPAIFNALSEGGRKALVMDFFIQAAKRAPWLRELSGLNIVNGR